MDLLPPPLYRLLRPLFKKQQLLRWHLKRAERLTGFFSTALPMIAVTSFFVGAGVLIIDKQRELAFYRVQSVGLRHQKLDDEREKLVQFLKQTEPVVEEEMVYKPIPKT